MSDKRSEDSDRSGFTGEGPKESSCPVCSSGCVHQWARGSKARLMLRVATWRKAASRKGRWPPERRRSRRSEPRSGRAISDGLSRWYGNGARSQRRIAHVAILPDGKWAPLHTSQYVPPGCVCPY
ncbi:hypothetical protein AVEN_56362-1 [Araneus ventricosus]|uniref:Uncharacterized protein n=1 Tax=Araneus ventricosus TaxID=182803 RepID=A0A4Y2LMA7_ARAVE|nr:hypothetical protein AVEN_56362-1 [Araneus ventricosus]